MSDKMIEYKAGRKMVIGICDDDKKWRESCKRTLIGFSTMIDMDMEVMCFSTAEELLEYKETPLDAARRADAEYRVFAVEIPEAGAASGRTVRGKKEVQKWNQNR